MNALRRLALLLCLHMLASTAFGDEDYSAKPKPEGKPGDEKLTHSVDGGRIKVKTGVDYTTTSTKRKPGGQP
jgi:hypothetical protein